MKSPNKGGGSRGRRGGKGHFVTKSGRTIKVNRNLLQRWVNHKDEKQQRKATRQAALPKDRFKRFLYHFEPRRMAKYWFSRDGGIMALKIIGIGIVAGFILLVGFFAYFRKDLPNLKDISGSNIGGSSRYYDRSGQTLLWEDYDAVKRIPVKTEEMSQAMRDATVVVEDKDFFKHGGFDVRGIIRAGWNDATGGSTQGGSTITQQLVKLTQNWSRDRTITRKVKELILAVELERTYSKQDILTGYLNAAPYGGIEYGVEAAARDYFQKSAKDLTLSEAAMLAAIPKAPRYYSPYSADFDKKAFAGRQQYILDLMEQQGKITKQQRDEAKKVDIIAEVKPRQNKYNGIKAPWFVLAAKKQLEDKFGDQTVKRGGWKVITTLDSKLQGLAEQQVQKGLSQVRRQGGDTAAFAAEDVKTGQMVALVGGSDFSNPDFGQINYAQTPLPPGSSFKPYDYTSLIENNTNVGAGSVIYDTQGPLEGYPCTNKALPKQGGNCLQDYDFRYPGPLSLRYALGGSRNIPAVKAMLINGVNKTIDTAQKLMEPRNGGAGYGYKCFTDERLTQQGQCYASSAIGDGAYLHLDQHVHGFASISRNGNNLPQTYILKITDAANKTVDEWKPTKGNQAVRPDAAYIVADMLSDPNASYFPGGRKPHRYNNGQGTWSFGMKTGTTNDGKDGWMMGFSTQYAAGVWVGYHTRRVVMSGTMENMTQPIWQGWMDAAHKDIKPEDRQKPSDLQTLPAYIVRSHVGIGSIEPSPANDLFPAWYKGTNKASNAAQTIDIVSNKLATSCTPERAKKITNDSAANQFSIDRFVSGGAAATTDTSTSDDVHICGEAGPSIRFANPPPSCPSACDFTVIVGQGAHPLNSDQFHGTINLIIGGQVIQSQGASSPGVYTFNGITSTGSQQVTAEVIDSVLYSASDVVVVDFSPTSGGSVVTFSITSAKITGANTKFTWNGGSGAVTIYSASNNVVLCSSSSSSNCQTVVANAPLGTQVYAKDTLGNSSPAATVTN